MNAKTKVEKRLASFKFKDHILNPEVIFENTGYATKRYINCLECGESFPRKDKTNSVICPYCQRKLKIKETRERKLNVFDYVEFIEAKETVQVFRTYFIQKEASIGSPRKITQKEVYRWYIVPKEELSKNQKNTFLAAVDTTANYNWRWLLYTELRFRKQNYNSFYKYYNWPSKVYKKKILPQFKYANHSTETSISTYEWYSAFSTHPQLEFLVKAKRYDLIRHMFKNKFTGYLLDNYSKEIKVIIKYKYILTKDDVYIWQDYIDLLKYFNKDTSNPKYTCPVDLHKEHNKLVEKKKLIVTEESNQEFIKRMQLYRNLKLISKKEEIEIKPFKDIAELKEESEVLHHCAFKSEYYNKKDSLLLSIKKEQKPIATAEISLKDKKIIQLRGEYNKTDFEEYSLVKHLITKKIIPQLNLNVIQTANNLKEVHDFAR